MHDSIGKALGVDAAGVKSAKMPPALAAQIHTAASDAYLRGMRISVLAGTAVVLAAAVVAWRFLPARALPETAEQSFEARLDAVTDDEILA